MTNTAIVWKLAPLLALLACVAFAVLRHATSKSHRLNKRPDNPYFFGGVWTTYKFDPEGDHPDDDWAIEDISRKTKKPRRKKPRRDRTSPR